MKTMNHIVIETLKRDAVYITPSCNVLGGHLFFVMYSFIII